MQQGIDDALERIIPTPIDGRKWVSIRIKAMSTIRLAIAPKIKYNYLKEIDPGV